MSEGKVNPANTPETRVTEATRIPMSLPQAKLAVPDIPGYHLHWFVGANVARAIKGGYQFVAPDEVDVQNTGLADDVSKNGSSDLGTRVSVIAGGIAEGDTQPQRLYLMKIRQEWWQQDQKVLEQRNEGIARALRSGIVGAENDPDKGLRYMKQGQDLFFPKVRKT